MPDNSRVWPLDYKTIKVTDPVLQALVVIATEEKTQRTARSKVCSAKRVLSVIASELGDTRGVAVSEVQPGRWVFRRADDSITMSVEWTGEFWEIRSMRVRDHSVIFGDCVGEELTGLLERIRKPGLESAKDPPGD